MYHIGKYCSSVRTYMMRYKYIHMYIYISTYYICTYIIMHAYLHIYLQVVPSTTTFIGLYTYQNSSNVVTFPYQPNGLSKWSTNFAKDCWVHPIINPWDSAIKGDDFPQKKRHDFQGSGERRVRIEIYLDWYKPNKHPSVEYLPTFTPKKAQFCR